MSDKHQTEGGFSADDPIVHSLPGEFIPGHVDGEYRADGQSPSRQLTESTEEVDTRLDEDTQA